MRVPGKIFRLFRALFIVVSTLGFIGCKKVDRLTQFHMVFNDTAVVKSSAGINLPFNVMTPDITTNSESTFEANDTRKDMVEKIVLKALDLTIVSPSGEDFGFLKSVQIFISAPGISEAEIAGDTGVPPDAGNRISLKTTGADLKDYIKSDRFSLRLKTITDEAITKDFYIVVHSDFFVDAKILGQ